MRLKDKVAIVTGGSRDIGREVVLKLAGEGARVVINYLNSESDAQRTREEVVAAGGEAIIVKGDVSKWKDVQFLVDETRKVFGDSIDILVNVAGGLFGRKPIEEQDEDWYNLVMDVNMKSVFFYHQGNSRLHACRIGHHQFQFTGRP